MKGEEQLKEELEEFQKEKERIRNIIGQIGGSNREHDRVVNLLFLIIIVTLLVLGSVFKIINPALAVQVAILFGILKMIWMFYESKRASHFQFWILNSLEYRINEIYRKTKRMEKTIKAIQEDELKREEKEKEKDKDKDKEKEKDKDKDKEKEKEKEKIS